MAGQKVDLRNVKKDTNIPKPSVIDMPGLKGTMPFSSGTIGGATATLPKEVVEEEQRLNSGPLITPEAEKQKAIKPPKVVPIETLPAAKQKEILSNVSEAMARAPSQSQFVPRGPGIAEAKFLADRVVAQTEQKLNNPKTVEPPKVTPPKKPEPQVQEDAAPVVEAPKGPDNTTTEAEICRHCGWPRSSSDSCNPDTLDKQMFVAAVLGQKRFSKDYALLGGQMNITFRSLTVEENDLVIKQLMQDWNDGKISGPAHSVSEATKYQLALSLASVETNVGIMKLPELTDYDYDPPEKGTVLPDIVAYVHQTALHNEPVRRIISKAYGHFIDTTSKLEAMAETPDFWQATVVRA